MKLLVSVKQTGCGEMDIDVVILTKNSVNPCLKECLKSIKENVDVNRLIVVDGGSTDATIDVITQFFPNALIINDREGNRATSRQKGIEAVSTDWFLFVDSDVVLNKDWMKHASKYLRPNVGAIEGKTFSTMPEIKHFHNAINRLPARTYRRGDTKNLLLRSIAVKGICIPSQLSSFEDYFMGNWVAVKGFLWIKAENEPSCKHYQVNIDPKKAIEPLMVAKRFGLISPISSIFASFTIFPKVCFALIFYPDIRMAVWQIKFQLFQTIGVLKACLA